MEQTHANRPSPIVEVLPATPGQEPVLSNLFQLYAHDFSEFHDIELDADGRFGYPDLPLYWREPDRHPFLVRVNGNLAGFVLVKKGSKLTGNAAVWDMAEFFVLRGYRRRGIGTAIAHEVWRKFPGPWEVRVMQSNQSAHRFWESAIPVFVGHAVAPVRIETNDTCWDVFSFDSTPIA